jgi:leucyl aminopeptidase (aminopeptidase T)
VNLALGTEATPNYLAIELVQAAQKLISEIRPVRPGQQVVITADTASDMRVVQATAGAVQAAGGAPTVLCFPTAKEPMLPPPRPVAAATACADIWFDFSVAYLLYSPAYYQAIQNGCIYVCLTGMDVDMMVRCIGRVSYLPMQSMANFLYHLSQAAQNVHVTSPAGTDLWMKVDKAGDLFWEAPPAQGGYPQMLGGQSGFNAVRENYEGVLVFDGTIWPPAEIGLLNEPVRLTLQGGYIQHIEGGAQAKAFARWLERSGNRFALLMDHACYGFNPGVLRPSGRILEDERVFGCMQFGIGASVYGSPVHTDGVTLNPSIWLDDLQIEQDGRYIHPQIIEYCHAMGAPDY